eukprot:236247-Pleurochrysis_carterae.AAC.1
MGTSVRARPCACVRAPPCVCACARACPRMRRLTAVALADAGIPTTLIADSAVFAMMARVNKARAQPLRHVCAWRERAQRAAA